MNEITNNNLSLEDENALNMMKTTANFEIESCDTLINFEDTNRYKKLKLTSSKKSK